MGPRPKMRVHDIRGGGISFTCEEAAYGHDVGQ